MKKVLIFHPTIAPYRVDFFNALNEICDMRLCLRYENLTEQHFDDYQAIIDRCNFKPIYLKHLCTTGKRVFSKGIITQIRDFSPDIVIGMEFSLEVCEALAYRPLSKKKYQVMTICDDSINMAAEGNELSKVHKLMRRIVAPKLDQIILTAPDVCEWYNTAYGKGVWFPIIRDERTERTKYADALPISNLYVDKYKLGGKSVFLFVGRLVELKRVEDIIEAFTRLKCPNAVLVIVGDGELRDTLKNKAQGNPDIIFTGRLEGLELIAWYNVATTFVLPSRLEPFGAVTNEALLGGCDAIVSRQCGSACLIEDDANGWKFDSGDIDALMRCMSKGLAETVPSAVISRPSKMLGNFSDYFENLRKYLD